MTHEQKQKSVCVMVGGRERFHQPTNEISQRSVCVCVHALCMFVSLDPHTVTLTCCHSQSEAPLSVLLPLLLVCCAILHQWCGELVLCYCCLLRSFPFPESSSTWLSIQLQRGCPSTPPLAVCICVQVVGGGVFTKASHNCSCIYMCVFFFLSSAAYISVCPLTSVCEGVPLQKTTLRTLLSYVGVCMRACVSLCQGVQPQGGSAEARQWQACLKYLGQTMLRAGGCSFTDS